MFSFFPLLGCIFHLCLLIGWQHRSGRLYQIATKVLVGIKVVVGTKVVVSTKVVVGSYVVVGRFLFYFF